MALGTDWSPDVPVEEELVTLGDVLGAYLEHRELRLRSTTMRRYHENIKLFRRFLEGRYPRRTVTPDMLSKPMLEAYYSWLLKPENGLHGRRRTPDTARKIVEIAQLAWRWADESEKWPGLIPRPRKIEMVREPPKTVVAPSWEDMDAVVRVCDGWIRCLAVFLRYSGLRVGETMQLRWSDVSLDSGRLAIRPEVDKSKRGRVVPLSPHLIEELEGWGRRERYLIPENGNGDRARQAVAAYMAHRWEKSGVSPDVWAGNPHHAFRKGFKTGMLSIGVHPDAIDYLQGHKLGDGARGRYIDPWKALHLDEVVKEIPEIGASNVVPLARRS